MKHTPYQLRYRTQLMMAHPKVVALTQIPNYAITSNPII